MNKYQDKLNNYFDKFKDEYDEYPTSVYVTFGIIVRGFIIFCIVLLFCLLPALLLYFLGYNERKEWNETANKTECLIINNYMSERVCNYKKYQKTRHYLCYDGFIIVSLNSTNLNLTKQFQIYKHEYNSTALTENLVLHYSNGTYIKCYHNKNHSPHLRLNEKLKGVYLSYAIFFFCMTGVIPFVWVILEIIGNYIFFTELF